MDNFFFNKLLKVTWDVIVEFLNATFVCLFVVKNEVLLERVTFEEK